MGSAATLHAAACPGLRGARRAGRYDERRVAEGRGRVSCTAEERGRRHRDHGLHPLPVAVRPAPAGARRPTSCWCPPRRRRPRMSTPSSLRDRRAPHRPPTPPHHAFLTTGDAGRLPRPGGAVPRAARSRRSTPPTWRPEAPREAHRPGLAGHLAGRVARMLRVPRQRHDGFTCGSTRGPGRSPGCRSTSSVGELGGMLISHGHAGPLPRHHPGVLRAPLRRAGGAGPAVLFARRGSPTWPRCSCPRTAAT